MYRNKRNLPATFNGVLENFLNNDLGKFFYDDNWSNITAPVNIKETEKAFELDVIAPGLKKEDFNINVEKDVLQISFEQKEEKSESTDKMIRNEYKFSSFKRHFTLTDKIDASNISAKYTDGVLSINLPKKENKEVTTQKIEIS